MSKLDFNQYLVSELSKVLHSGDFNVSYCYRANNKSSILVSPLLTASDVALCELKQLCVSSKSLGHRYIISLEHLTCNEIKKSYINTIEQYELSMPNYPDFKSIVKSVENAHIINNNFHSLKSKKGGVK